MTAHAFIRRSHRWVAITFILLVLANVVAYSFGQPALWLVYSPLLPLLPLMLSGLYMLSQPWAARGPTPAQETRA